MSPLIAMLLLGGLVWGVAASYQRDRGNRLPRGCLVSRTPAARESRSTINPLVDWHVDFNKPAPPAPVAYDMLAAYYPKNLETGEPK
jgi:hypothetical protein